MSLKQREEVWVYMEGSIPLAVLSSRRSALARVTRGIPLTPEEARRSRALLEEELKPGAKFLIVGNLETKQKDRQIVLVHEEDP
jgi:hypothetical protein